MNSSDEAYFNGLINNAGMNIDLELIKERVKEIYKESIQTQVYDSYFPSQYVRTDQLLDDIAVKINDDGSLVVYNDTNSMNYTSVVSGKNVSPYVAGWINYGHHDNSGIDNMYHNYEGRDFLFKAKELIEQEYPGVIVTVI